MKEYKDKRSIELRLNELDRMGSQIIFACDSLSNTDKERIKEIELEMDKLRIQLQEMEVKQGD